MAEEKPKTKSMQPRFFATDENPEQFFLSTARLAFNEDEPQPPYIKDSRARDTWLTKFYKTEPHLNGVINSVTAIDKNRGWRVVGGRNQVNRITNMLHNFEVAPGLRGWRPALATASQAFWTTDLGTIVELGKESKYGPVTALFNVDSTKCHLTGMTDYPLKYSSKGGIQKWSVDDFFRVVSSPCLFEEYNALGNCALSRCVQLAQLMVALYRHDEEKLLSRAPRGLLLLSGIRQKQWEEAMAARDATLDSNETKYYGAIAVLASAASTVDAKLLALSELPANFELREWMDMLMYGYALCFGYDASEFWPVQYGALGRGNETQIQHEKATGKGRLDFVLGFQEQLENFLPDSIDFEFDQRDEQGDLIHASVHQAWSTVAETLYKKAQLITVEEGRMLLAQFGIIPSSWTESKAVETTDEVDISESENTGNDGQSSEPADLEGLGEGKNKVAASPTANLRPTFKTNRLEMLKNQLRDSACVRRAAEKYPDEEIVQYSYPGNHIVTLWDRGDEVYKRQSFPIGTPPPLPEFMRGAK
jgi:hypothetical protein